MVREKQRFTRWSGWLLLAPLVLAAGALGMGKKAEAVVPSPGYRLGQNYPFSVKPIFLKLPAPRAAGATLQSGNIVPGSEFDTITDGPAPSPPDPNKPDTTYSRPDGAIAASPSYLMCAGNSILQIRKHNGQLVYEAPYNALFGYSPELLHEYRYTRVSYDQVARRFFFLTNLAVYPIVNVETGARLEVTIWILLVSADADPFKGFYAYVAATSRGDMWPGVPVSLGPSPIDPASLPADPRALPTEASDMTALGYDKSAIYLSFDMHLANTGGRPFSGNELFILDKAKALKGEAITPKVVHDIFVPRGPLAGVPTPLDFYAQGLRPAEGATTTAPGLVMNYHPTAGLLLFKVKNALTSPVVENVVLHGTPYPPAPPALQPPTSTTLLPTGGTELHKTTFRNNLIYTAHTVGNAIDGSVGPAQIHWYVINPALGTITAQGTIADPAISFFHPSFVPDNFGKAVLVCHASGPLNVPSIYHTWFDGTTMIVPPQLTEASQSTFEWKDGNQQSAWGSYSDASTDPSTQTQVWIQGQLVSSPKANDPAYPYWIYWKLRAAKIVATPPPVAPSELKAQALSSEEVKLTWKDNSCNEQGFRIERKAGSGSFVGAGTAAANATSFNDKGVLGGTTYTYRIRSYIGGTTSAYSNLATVTTPLPVPAAPSELAVTALSTTTARLTWKDNSPYEQGVKIERKLGTGAYAQVGTAGANAVEFESAGLVAGSTYTFRVRAYNTTGNSAYSNEASITMPVPPAAPTTLTATVKAVGQIVLKWADKSTNEDGFRIERKTGTGAYAEITTTGANTITYTDLPSPGATYKYRVRAYKGVASSAYSNEATATLPAAPAAPTNLQATVVNGQVKLTWKDNANNELGFKVERRSFFDYMSPPKEIGSVGANITTYTDTTLTQKGYFSYRVRAWNNGAYSAYAEVMVNVQ